MRLDGASANHLIQAEVNVGDQVVVPTLVVIGKAKGESVVEKRQLEGHAQQLVENRVQRVILDARLEGGLPVHLHRDKRVRRRVLVHIRQAFDAISGDKKRVVRPAHQRRHEHERVVVIARLRDLVLRVRGKFRANGDADD